MSYDLIVFEPTAAPRDRNAFLDWYESQTQWAEDHSYNDPSVTTTGLSAWFSEIRLDFPNMNGPGAYNIAENQHNPRVTDYCIGRLVIYTCFAWSEAENAYAIVRALAVKHGVGFFNVSADNGEIWLPPTDHAPDTTAIPSLTLTLEGQQPFEAPSIALIEAAADWLDPCGGPGFLILKNRNGSYAQVGGGKDACTLEWRECESSSFRHWVAGMLGQGSTTMTTIPGNGTYFSVQANEILSKEGVKSILIAFAQGHARPNDLDWRDMTSRFGGGEPPSSNKPWWRFWR